ncbi:MAG: hypothetical protein KIH69_015685 [Anaerolineae bacterium]|nr:hypothetical protein [Anaerolineae bacterium]
MRFNIGICALATSLVLAACASPTVPVRPTATPNFCQTFTEDRWVKNASGNVVIIQGANLPTLSDMEKGGPSALDRLTDLAARGATAVRLQISKKEISQTFIPLKVLPFVHAANQLGLLVILAWDDVIEEVNNPQITATEEWIRQLIIYLPNEPGVWLDPISEMRSIPMARRRNVAQRYLDLMRGYRLPNVVVINEAFWLLENDPELNKPLQGGNIVYGLRKLDQPAQWPLDKYPFLITDWDGAAYPAASKIGSMSRVGLDANTAQAQWKTTTPVCK